MKHTAFVAAIVTAVLFVPSARADDVCVSSRAPVTWGGTAAAASKGESSFGDAPAASRARELLARAKVLDEAAEADERFVVDFATRLPQLRVTAKAARERSDRATGGDRTALVARAEDLEAELAVGEAESISRQRSAADNRRVARELRTRAVKLARDATREPAANDLACDPPYSYSAEGRRVYRLQCFR